MLSEDREERNWEKADDNYKDVQRFIVKAEHLELYEDVERLIPEHIKPECVEMHMEIEEYTREDTKAKKGLQSPLPKGKKRVRNDDALRNVPTGASTGFISVKDLLQKGTKKVKIPDPKDLEHAGEDDEDDLAIEAGILGPRRTVSLSAAEKPKTKKLKRSKTVATGEASGSKTTNTKSRKKKAPAIEELPMSQLARLGEDDSDDEAIAAGVGAVKSASSGKKRKKARSPSPEAAPPKPSRPKKAKVSPVEPKTPPMWSSSPERPLADRSIIDITTPSERPASLSPPQWSSPLTFGHTPIPHDSSPPPAPADNADDSMAWLLDDDEDPDIEFVNSSPLFRHDEGTHLDQPLSLNLDDSEIELVDESVVLASFNSNRTNDSQRSQSKSTQEGRGMLPPPLPARFAGHSSPDLELDEEQESDGFIPPSTFAVRVPGQRGKKRTRLATLDSSPLAMPPPSQRRIRHLKNSSESSPSPDAEEPTEPSRQPKRKRRKFTDVVEAQRHNPWMDVEAGHSGDEVSGGDEDGDDTLSESDMRFAGDFSATQASPSYDQAAVYRRSLMTQAPGGPAFANRPMRRAMFAVPDRPARVDALSSSPPRNDESDDYMYGSFVVADDADISYAGEPSHILSDDF